MSPLGEVSRDVWIVGAMLAAGLASAWLARLHEGSPWQTACHRLFFLCLVTVAGLTVVALHLGPGLWIASGATLSVMVITATGDFSSAAES